MYELGISPVLKNINSVRFCRIMKTVLILALIVTACICSGGDASEKSLQDDAFKKSLREDEQEDEQVHRDVMRRYRADPGLMFQKMVKGAAEATDPTTEEVVLMIKQRKEEKHKYEDPRTTNDELSRYKSYLERILGVSFHNNDALKGTVMQLLSVIRYGDDDIPRKDPPSGLSDEVKRILQLMSDIVYAGQSFLHISF
jgi:hypothetical protein